MTEPRKAQAQAPTPRFDISQFGQVGPEGDIRRILVVAAHPDDLETTCGGTLALLVDAGVQVALLLCTDGDIGTHDPSYTRETLAAARRDETLAGAHALGLGEVFFLGQLGADTTTASWSPTCNCGPRSPTSTGAGSPTRSSPSTRTGTARRIRITRRRAGRRSTRTCPRRWSCITRSSWPTGSGWPT